jgi:hypothetical protein
MKHLLASILLAATPALAQSGAPVRLRAADQQKLGVEIAVLGAREIAQTEAAFIRVLDPAPLAALDADRTAAAAAASASHNQLKRALKLAGEDQSASQQSVEAARAQAAADQSRLVLLSRRLTFEWGPEIAAMTDPARAALLTDLVSGDAALLRADAPQRPNGIAGAVVINSDAGRAVTVSETLGFAGAADPRMQTIGLYAVARGEATAGLRPGRVFNGGIETSRKTTGVVIPREASVRLDGAAWAYFQSGEETFERRELGGSTLIADGWFVAEGTKPGDRVVVKGAGSLLAVERADEAVEAD